MSDEKKEVKNEEWESGSDLIWAYLILFICFSTSWKTSDTKDHELRERVARLEGQMDMLRR